MPEQQQDQCQQEPVPVDRFLWERLLMVSDLPQGDRFKLLALGIFMDGATGDGARPGNANLAMFGPHEETWKQLLRRAVKAGWLVLRERGGSRKGPGGTRVRRASRYAASVPASVWARREEVLSSPPFRASKEAPADGGSLPSTDGPSTNEALGASFDAPEPAGSPAPAPVEGSPKPLPSTSTKEASEVYEGSIPGVRRKPLETSPSNRPTSHPPTSKIGSDPTRALRDDVQDRKGARWLEGNWPGVDEAVAADILQGVRAEAARYGREIGDMVGYLKRMQREGDLTDFVEAAFNRAGQLEAASKEAPPAPEQEPLRSLPGGAPSSGAPSAATQMTTLHALPDEPDTEPGPVVERDERGIPAVDERADLRTLLARINTRRQTPTEGTGT